MAARQHGVVTRRQLLESGLSSAAVVRRVEKGLLHREHQGVYRVGHRAPSTEARYVAAVLAAGTGAVLSGPAAAYVLGLLKGSPPRPEVSTARHRRVAGVVTRRPRQLGTEDVTVFRRIPITTVARTLVDLAPTRSLDALARVCHEAQVRHGVTGAMVEPRSRGGRVVAARRS